MPDHSPFCPRCLTVVDDVLHRFAYYPPVTRLWRVMIGMFPVDHSYGTHKVDLLTGSRLGNPKCIDMPAG